MSEFTDRTILFVPGDRPDRFAQALSSDADAICVDLEDAVSLPKKTIARNICEELLNEYDLSSGRVFVRHNPLTTSDGLQDLLMLLARGDKLSGLISPKISSPEDLRPISENFLKLVSNIILIPLIETPEGLRRCVEIARHPLVAALALGPLDLAAAANMSITLQTMLPIRSSISLAAAECGKAVLDGPYTILSDADSLSLSTEAEIAKNMGFTGKLVIHPKQVQPVNSAFTPSAAQIKLDQQVAEAFAGSDDGVVVIDGRMIDKPVIVAAERRLRLAYQLGLI